MLTGRPYVPVDAVSPHKFSWCSPSLSTLSQCGQESHLPLCLWHAPLVLSTIALRPSQQLMVSFIVLPSELMKLRRWEVKVKGKSLAKFTELGNNGGRHGAQAAALIPHSLPVTQSWTAISTTISKMQTKKKVPWDWLLGENSNNTIITTGTLNCVVVVELCYMNKLQEITFSVVRICRGNTDSLYWISKKNSCFESHGAAGQDMHTFLTSSKLN